MIEIIILRTIYKPPNTLYINIILQISKLEEEFDNLLFIIKHVRTKYGIVNNGILNVRYIYIYI